MHRNGCSELLIGLRFALLILLFLGFKGIFSLQSHHRYHKSSDRRRSNIIMTSQPFSFETPNNIIKSEMLFRKVFKEVLSNPNDDSDEIISSNVIDYEMAAFETLSKMNELISHKMNVPNPILSNTMTMNLNHPLLECTMRTSHLFQTWMTADANSSKHSNKKSTRQDLINFVQVTDFNSSSNALSLVLLVSHLALDTYSPASISRALVSGLLSSTTPQEKSNAQTLSCHYTHGKNIALKAIQALLEISLEDHPVDLQIVSRLAKCLEIYSLPPNISQICASVIQKHLHRHYRLSGQVVTEIDKQSISDVLGLAAQLSPWSDLSPIPLVEMAMNHQLWYAAERLCDSCISYSSDETNEVIQTLIDGARDQHLYRMMDTYATTYYHHGGQARFAEARYMHACDTISKVIPKRQYPIIEKQVERVDEAFNRLKEDIDEKRQLIERNGPQEIREFVLMQLSEANQDDVALRLAKIWGFDSFYDQDFDFEQMEKLRREKYIQYQNVFQSLYDVPAPISCPQLLIQSIATFIQTIGPGPSVIGFDVEWGEEKGAALLQLSTIHQAILIDIPALIQTEDGCNSLEMIGKLFAGNTEPWIIVAGFSCSEDISRLRASSALGTRRKPWLESTDAVVDIKALVTVDHFKLKHLGLSRLCEFYFGKPLDKSEQCSSWLRRPLTKYQREYACLDSWAVVAIWHKLPSDITSPYLNRNFLK